MVEKATSTRKMPRKKRSAHKVARLKLWGPDDMVIYVRSDGVPGSRRGHDGRPKTICPQASLAQVSSPALRKRGHYLRDCTQGGQCKGGQSAGSAGLEAQAIRIPGYMLLHAHSWIVFKHPTGIVMESFLCPDDGGLS